MEALDHLFNLGDRFATTEELKKELKTRKHIPNKKEAKELGRLSIKAG